MRKEGLPHLKKISGITVARWRTRRCLGSSSWWWEKSVCENTTVSWGLGK